MQNTKYHHFRDIEGWTEFRAVVPSRYAESTTNYPWVPLSDWQIQLVPGDDIRFGNDAHRYAIVRIHYTDDYFTTLNDELIVRRIGTNDNNLLAVKRNECIPIIKYCECGAPKTTGMRFCHPDA